MKMELRDVAYFSLNLPTAVMCLKQIRLLYSELKSNIKIVERNRSKNIKEMLVSGGCTGLVLQPATEGETDESELIHVRRLQS